MGDGGFSFSIFHLVCIGALEHFRFPFFDAHHARGKFFGALEAE